MTGVNAEKTLDTPEISPFTFPLKDEGKDSIATKETANMPNGERKESTPNIIITPIGLLNNTANVIKMKESNIYA